MQLWSNLQNKWRGYQDMNPNVKLSLWWTWAETSSQSIRSGDVMSAFIFLQSGSNGEVGYIQGVNGVFQLLLAVPAGWAADRFRRDSVLRGAALIGTLAACVLAFALLTNAGIYSLYLAMGLLGAYRGSNNPAIESIFSDSVQTGHSSDLYTVKWIVQMISSCCGPLLSVLLFATLGNTWEAGTCRTVLLVGLATMAFPLLFMCFFNDDNALGLPSEAIQESASYQSLPDVEHPEGQPKSKWNFAGLYTVPILISISDLISALASGMTIKFFPLFFFEVVHLTPIYVSAISIAAPLAIGLFSVMLERASHWCGSRVYLSLVTKYIDVGLLVAMAFTPTEAAWAKRLLVGMHLLRTAFANSSRPLMRSVLMDHVPKRLRGRFNALESVRVFGWSGSAAAGGIFIQHLGFKKTFLITAAIKVLSNLPLTPLIALVTDDKGRDAAGHVYRSSAPQLPTTAQQEQQQPLLSDGNSAHKPEDQ